jgi:hypothetical protein
LKEKIPIGKRKAGCWLLATRDIERGQRSSAPQTRIILSSVNVCEFKCWARAHHETFNRPRVKFSHCLSERSRNHGDENHKIVSVGDLNVNRLIIKYKVAIIDVYIHFSMFCNFIVAMTAPR